MKGSLRKGHSTQKTSKAIILTQIPLHKCTNLTILDLSRNQISKMENLNSLKYLTSLNLSHNKISKVEDIFQLHQLSNLFLNNNHIEYISGEIRQLLNLNHFDLSHNRVLYLHSLRNMEGMRLQILDLSGNRVVKRSGFKQLMEILVAPPMCENEAIEESGMDKDEAETMLTLMTTVPLRTPISETRTPEHLNIQASALPAHKEEEEDNPELEYRSQLERMFEAKAEELYSLKSHVLEVYERVVEGGQVIKDLAVRDRQILEEMSSSEVVFVIGKYMLRVKSQVQTTIKQLYSQLQSIFLRVESAEISQPQFTLRADPVDVGVQHEQILVRMMECVSRGDLQFVKYKSLLIQYSGAFNSFEVTVDSLRQAVTLYTSEINNICHILEIKHSLESSVLASQQEPITCMPVSEIHKQQQTISTLQKELGYSLEYQRELIRENESLLGEVDAMKGKNHSLSQRVEELDKLWLRVEEIKYQEDRTFESVIEKQEQIINLMEGKLSSDFMQQVILNQARTIEELIDTNHILKAQFITKEVLPAFPYKHNIQQTQETLGTGRKSSRDKNPQSSPDSNLLSSGKPQRHITQFNPYSKPNPYFHQSISLFKSKPNSQPSTRRHSHTNNNSLQKRTDRINENVKSDNRNATQSSLGNARYLDVKGGVLQGYNRSEVEEGKSYRKYMEYCLRNNILDVLVEKQTNSKMKERYSAEELKRAKFKSLNSKNLLRNK